MVNHDSATSWWERQRGRFVSSCLIAVLAFVSINLIVINAGPFTARSAEEELVKQTGAEPREKSFTGWNAKAYVEQTKSPDIVLLGSSLMGNAVAASDARLLQKNLDAAIYRRCASLEHALKDRLGTKVSVFNWSVPGEMMSDMYMINGAFFKGRLKPKLIVMEAAPRDFNDNLLPYAGATEQFRFLAKYVDLADLADEAFPDLMARLEYEFDKVVPLRTYRFEGFREPELAEEKRPDAKPGGNASPILGGGMFSVGAVHRGQWVTPPALPLMFTDNTKEYKRRFHIAKPPLYAVEMKFFDRVLEQLSKAGIKVAVVGMPTLSLNRKLLPDSFWTEWKSDVKTVCDRHNAVLVDLSDSPKFDLSDYLDMVHMNANGGAKLFDFIAEAIVSKPDLVSALEIPNKRTSLAGEATIPQ